ncbi:glycosyl transferase [Lachnospiraceae bacterium JC7]|nr:glycosyl transferase [Lachnospiraceae bacterium JC7]
MAETASSIKKEDKVLTISIAAYNVEKTIGRTLDSLVKNVPGEVLGRLDIIVVNDGSKDNTLSIVKNYSDSYPDVITIIDKENGGWGSTVNSSLKQARGKYYKLLDGDDWFVSENLKEYVDFLIKAEADMVLAPYVKCYPQKEYKEDHHKEIGSDVCDIEVLKLNTDIYMHEVAVKTERLRRDFRELTKNCFYTDMEFMLDVIMASENIQRFGKEIYVYQLGSDGQSVSVDGLRRHHKDTVRVAQKMYGLFYKYMKEAEVKRTDGHDNDSKITNIVINQLLERELVLITELVYVSHLLTNSTVAKKELKLFDQEIREKYKYVNGLIKKGKKIMMLRLSNFALYRILAVQIEKRYNLQKAKKVSA